VVDVGYNAEVADLTGRWHGERMTNDE